jgi:hypothetical protein
MRNSLVRLWISIYSDLCTAKLFQRLNQGQYDSEIGNWIRDEGYRGGNDERAIERGSNTSTMLSSHINIMNCVK